MMVFYQVTTVRESRTHMKASHHALMIGETFARMKDVWSTRQRSVGVTAHPAGEETLIALYQPGLLVIFHQALISVLMVSH